MYSKENVLKQFDEEFPCRCRSSQCDGQMCTKNYKQFLISTVNGVLGEVITKPFFLCPYGQEHSTCCCPGRTEENQDKQELINTARALGWEVGEE